MIHDTLLFHFQRIIENVRSKKENKTNKPLLDSITKDTEFEDLTLYKEYLSKFDIEHDFEGVKLNYPPNLKEYKADFFVLFQLAVASFASNYGLECNEDPDGMELVIMVDKKDKHVTKKLSEMLWHHIVRLFDIYIDEQINLEALRTNSDEERKVIDKERELRLMVYQKKVKQYHYQRQKKNRQLTNEEESQATIADLDDLLNG